MSGTTQLRHLSEDYLPGTSATRLNTVDVWIPESSPEGSGVKLWVIYLHGGAWRDPAVDSKSFEPALMTLSKSPLASSIKGFASINYRLSPYPSHPDDPSSPDDPSRNVRHPAHLYDVEYALIYLEQKYKISTGFILAGHSAGATLAFQQLGDLGPFKVPIPACILGISGIYNFDAFVEAHKDSPVYRQFMENAFPPNGIRWKDISPYSFGSEVAAWEYADLVLIAHSPEDELVEEKQAEYMLERVRRTTTIKHGSHFLKASGSHDDIWRNGHVLSGLLEEALKRLT